MIAWKYTVIPSKELSGLGESHGGKHRLYLDQSTSLHTHTGTRVHTGPLFLGCALRHTPTKCKSIHTSDRLSAVWVPSALPLQWRRTVGVVGVGVISAQLRGAEGCGRRGWLSTLGRDSLSPDFCKARAASGTPGTILQSILPEQGIGTGAPPLPTS